MPTEYLTHNYKKIVLYGLELRADVFWTHASDIRPLTKGLRGTKATPVTITEVTSEDISAYLKQYTDEREAQKSLQEGGFQAVTVFQWVFPHIHGAPEWGANGSLILFSFNTGKVSLRLSLSGADSPRYLELTRWNNYAFHFICFELQFTTVIFILQLSSITVKSIDFFSGWHWFGFLHVLHAYCFKASLFFFFFFVVLSEQY